jgi:hypothetical protein
MPLLTCHWRDHIAVRVNVHTLTARGLRAFMDPWKLTPAGREPLSNTRACRSAAVLLGSDGLQDMPRTAAGNDAR